MYRFTERKSSDVILVEAVDRDYAARLHSKSLPLLTSPATAASSNETRFISKAIDAGWLTTQGTLNGTLGRVDREPWLRKIQIEVALTCNFSCDYCYSGSAPTRPERLSLDQIERTLTQANSIGTSEICFTGGEFLIHKQWKDIVACSRDLGFITDIHTNAFRLTDKAIEYLSDQRIRQLQVTLESHDAAIHESIRGIRGGWQRTVDNVRKAQAAGLNVRIVTQVHKKNIESIGETVRWINDELQMPMYLDRIIAGDTGTHLAVTESEFWAAVSPLLGLGAKASRVCDSLHSPAPGVEPECGVGQSFLYLTASGEIAMCPTMTSRENEQFRGPNIEDTDLASAWYDNEMFNRYRGFNCENTSRCPAAKVCTGGCRSNAYAATGRVDAPDVVACNIFKNPTPVYVDFLRRYEDGSFGPLQEDELNV